MSEGPDRWLTTGRRNGNGETQEPRVISGQVWHRSTSPRQAPVIPYDSPVVAPYGSGTAGEHAPHRSGGDHPGHQGGGRSSSTRPRWVRPSRPRRIARLLGVLLCALAVTGGGTYAWADFRLDRSVDLSAVAHRPPSGRGTTYLIVGSDGRNGLSERARKQLHTGTAGGSRTDSMMLLHTGAHGTTLVSLPRDSWVTLPSYVDPDTGKLHRASKNKLNAAYSVGGPRLLVRTVELNTGVRVDHYAEIGFAGFVGVVDAVGGVEMCVDRHIKDPKSGADLEKGCHNLNGAQALAFVRQRHQEADGDLGRSRNQRKFLSALAHRTAQPGTALDPSRAYPALSAALDTLVVDEDMDLPTLASLFQAMRSVSGGNGIQLNVPVDGLGLRTSKGSALTWNEAKAKRLFTELRNDQPVSIEGKN
ncbi:LCP family protein [Streptomyces poonensis]|uniref:Transcriptional regulator n=1 Tax=Streptomyces poonensis TaxID=68255 RepID=A0A918PF93_9ACTN|nr:LCP family protein [Streptomyces poonensis]GGZ03535.1 transcriptional regulator [Streptomyces poonensis]GLJ90736.1 transcriptional regulator [Streptomyces poonensis]